MSLPVMADGKLTEDYTMKKLLISAVALCSASAMAVGTHPGEASFSPQQTHAIEKIIRNYLIANPQVLVETAQALKLQQMQRQQTQANAAIEQNKQQLFHDPKTPSIGPAKPKAYVVEFFDYQCGHCRAVAETVKNIIGKDKSVKFIFKELPIFGGASKLAAQAALAADKYGKYKPVHDHLFSTSDKLSKQSILDFTTKAGLNAHKIANDMKKTSINTQIKDNFKLAQKLGIMGTPAFVIGNGALTKFVFLPGAVDEARLEATIKAVQK